MKRGAKSRWRKEISVGLSLLATRNGRQYQQLFRLRQESYLKWSEDRYILIIIATVSYNVKVLVINKLTLYLIPMNYVNILLRFLEKF
jgi:hypothetical protein